MHRALVVVLALASCRKPEPLDRAELRRPIDAAPDAHLVWEHTEQGSGWVDPRALADASTDAAVDAAPAPVTASIDARYFAYVYLLTVDVYLGEILDGYPGVPTGTRYNSFLYRWPLPDEKLRKRMRDSIEIARGYAGSGNTDEVAAAVSAYTDVVLARLPGVLDLADYYEDKRYVDDEFGRGRTDAGQVKALVNELARVRPALWSTVLEAWRTAAGDVPDSPRAMVSRAWEACARVGQAVVMKLDARALDVAVAACRRGVSTVAALPAAMHDTFDVILRDTAVELGDYAAGSRMPWEIPSEILEVTKAYLDRWPRLPGAPAERTP